MKSPAAADGSVWAQNLRVRTKMLFVLGVLVGIIVASSIAFLATQRQLAGARAWTSHTQEVISRIEQLRTAIVDRETGLRGYVISGREDFLEPYREGEAEFARQLKDLRTLTRDNALQQGRLDQIDRISQRWRNQFAQRLLQEMSEGRRQEAIALVVSGAGKLITDELRALFKEFIATEEVLLVQRDQRLQRIDRNMKFLTLALLLLGVASGTVAALAMQRLIARPLAVLSELIPRLAGGERVEVPHQRRRDEIGRVAQALVTLQAASQRQLQRDWVKTRQAEINAALQHCETHQDFGQTLLLHLCRALGIGYGLAYRWNEEHGELECAAGYGLPDGAAPAQRFKPGAGLVGQALSDRRLLEISPAPPEHFRILSGLGDGLPHCLLLLPLIARGEVVAVLELAGYAAPDAAQRELLDEMATPAALGWQTLSRSIRTRELLEQTQMQAEELKTSEEALRVQQEQLRSTNETLRDRGDLLEEQRRRLTASDEELRAQAEELRVANTTLQENSLALTQRQVELERARLELERKAQDLERASAYKSEFLANMSHELRTPLNSLLILSKGLADNDEGNLNAEQIESARIVHESGRSLLHLINDILDLSKVEAGKMELSLEELDLAGFAAQQERAFRHVAENRGLSFEVQREPELPQRIVTDGARLAQIVGNLLSNAFKFTHQGGVTLRIARPSAALKLAQPGLSASSAIAFIVSDTGIGIDQDQTGLVFQAFQQADSGTSRRYGGTGLGLSIVRGMSELLGGEVQLSSRRGEGSTFTLVLPERHAPVAPPTPAAAEPAPAPPEEVARPALPAPSSDAASAPAILIVEDDAVFAGVLADIAARKNLRTLHAGRGETALQLARTEPLLGVLLDLGLPDMSGWQVLDSLKADPRTSHLPVHIISATDEISRGLAMGAVGFLVKPATREDVLAALAKVSVTVPDAPRRLLLIDDSADSRAAVRKLLEGEQVEIVEAADGNSALAMLQAGRYDCVILDLGLPDISGFEWLEQAARFGAVPPVVVYSARDLTPEENLQLRGYTESIVIKGSRSQERLLDEVSLFLHAVHRPVIASNAAPRQPLSDIAGRIVLIVDDDMRNIFALSKALRSRGLKVLMAQDGLKALGQIEANPDIDIVLMDIMMPGMDGYETMRRIRAREEWKTLPIIAVTAKAMRGDREKCIEAGANDYCSKPIDVDQLVSLIRVWV